MKSLLIIASYVLGLTACTDPQTKALYLCDQQVATLTTINEHSAILSINNKNYQLTHERHASGNKYISEDVLFWGKSNEAMLIVAGTKYRCVQQSSSLQ
jgi:membrane-bound inhibitor of C-type lysozyme